MMKNCGTYGASGRKSKAVNLSVNNTTKLSNSLHKQCVTEIKKLTQNSNPDTLGIANQFNDFVLWDDREDKEKG